MLVLSNLLSACIFDVCLPRIDMCHTAGAPSMDSPGVTTTTTNTIDHIISSAATATDSNTAAVHSSCSSSSSDLVAYLLIKAVFPSHQRYPAHDPPTFTLSGTLNGTPFDSSVLELLKKAGEEVSQVPQLEVKNSAM
jgi:hypothetical protein